MTTQWEDWKDWAVGSKIWPGENAPPELSSLIGCPQDPEYHPEGDVWEHTLLVVDAARDLVASKKLSHTNALILVFAALLHDVGKPHTTEVVDGKIRSPRHAIEGAMIAEDFLLWIGAPNWLIANVKPLVREHMIHTNNSPPTRRTLQRLARRLEPSNIGMLRLLVLADHRGRPPRPEEDPLVTWEILACSYGADKHRPARILMGRHLIEEGIEPGPYMGDLLRVAYEAQMDGAFKNLAEALVWVRARINNGYSKLAEAILNPTQDTDEYY